MSKTAYAARTVMAQAALKQMPPLVRKTLLKEREFRDDYGLKTDAVLTFGDCGVSIQCSRLFNAIREIFSGTSELGITDTEGREWRIKDETENQDLPTLVISAGKRRLILPDFSVLSPNPVIRLRSLDEASVDANLPICSQEIWRTILSERPLENDELDEFYNDLRDTPVYVMRSIRNEIERGQSSVLSLVPSSRKYFDRLVGAFNGSMSIREFAASAGKQFFAQMSAWRPDEGFIFSLLLSSHSALTSEISVEQLDVEDLVHLFDFLVKQGDRLAQLGAIEIGLRILPKWPELEPSIIRLVEQIRDDDVEKGAISGFKLLSALFVLVDGELSRTRLMANEPPFYRRLASFSHAALIHRQLVNCDVSDTFCEWAYNSCSEQYYMQSFADMRSEPRWNPDLASASQLKADFFGRIMISAAHYDTNIKASKLHDLIFGAQTDSLQSLSEFPRPYLPGPLEGAEENQNTLPIDLSGVIERQLNADQVGPSSFIALVNSAMIFRVEVDQAELAAKALKLCNHHLSNLETQSQLFDILNGLASVAANVRYPALADELRILLRRYRSDSQHRISIEGAMRICLVASASHKDFNKWRESVGDWLTELAFGELHDNEGYILHSHLKCLCHAVPELWVSCSKADAALKAYNESPHRR